MSTADELAVDARAAGMPQTGAAISETAESSSLAYWQRRILISTIIGYALYYIVRKNLTVAMPAMEQSGGQGVPFLHDLVHGFAPVILVIAESNVADERDPALRWPVFSSTARKA